jgi:hypothetical protein
MNEGSGQTVGDAGSAPVNGVLGDSTSVEASDPSWVAGKFGSALFYMSGQHVTVGDAHTNGLTQFTFEAWIKRSAPGADVLIGEEETPSSDFSIESYTDGNVYLNIGDGTTIDDGYFASNDTKWHHVAFVFDGTLSGNSARLKGYLDGVLQTLHFDGTIPSSVHVNDTSFYLGKVASGTIDDVRIFTYPRTANQIAQIDYSGGGAN